MARTTKTMAIRLSSWLRYYSPEKVKGRRPWPLPPHLYFANLKLDWASLLGFNERFGQLLPSMRLEGVTESDVEQAREMQRLLQSAWRGDQAAIELIQFGAGRSEIAGPIQVKPVPTNSGLDIYTGDLWTFIRIAFLADRSKERFCANPDCIMPYFLARRKDARVCGAEECREWAQRQWALDWWHRNAARKGRGRKSHDS